jgi:hypothetical protein
MEAIRKDVHSLLAALTRHSALGSESMRRRIGSPNEDEGTLRALARELAILKNKKKP